MKPMVRRGKDFFMIKKIKALFFLHNSKTNTKQKQTKKQNTKQNQHEKSKQHRKQNNTEQNKNKTNKIEQKTKQTEKTNKQTQQYRRFGLMAHEERHEERKNLRRSVV